MYNYRDNDVSHGVIDIKPITRIQQSQQQIYGFQDMLNRAQASVVAQ
jgi:hypothetical protein